MWRWCVRQLNKRWWIRQVSKSEGLSLAHHYDAAFFETSAAEEFAAVERVYHEAIREVLREQERYMPIRSLYIANEDNKSSNSFLTINGNDGPERLRVLPRGWCSPPGGWWMDPSASGRLRRFHQFFVGDWSWRSCFKRNFLVVLLLLLLLLQFSNFGWFIRCINTEIKPVLGKSPIVATRRSAREQKREKEFVFFFWKNEK